MTRKHRNQCSCRFAGLASLVLAVWRSAIAAACPSCYTGQLARAQVLGDRFWQNLAAVLLPILIMAFLTALLYRIGLPRALTARRQPATRPPEGER